MHLRVPSQCTALRVARSARAWLESGHRPKARRALPPSQRRTVAGHVGVLGRKKWDCVNSMFSEGRSAFDTCTCLEDWAPASMKTTGSKAAVAPQHTIYLSSVRSMLYQDISRLTTKASQDRARPRRLQLHQDERPNLRPRARRALLDHSPTAHALTASTTNPANAMANGPASATVACAPRASRPSTARPSGVARVASTMAAAALSGGASPKLRAPVRSR